RRAWRESPDRQRAEGSAVLHALIEAGVKPGDLDDAFDRVCDYAEVEFPAGAGGGPDPAPAGKALQQFWEALEALLPNPVDPKARCSLQSTMRDFRRRLRVGPPGPPRVGAGGGAG